MQLCSHIVTNMRLMQVIIGFSRRIYPMQKVGHDLEGLHKQYDHKWVLKCFAWNFSGLLGEQSSVLLAVLAQLDSSLMLGAALGLLGASRRARRTATKYWYHWSDTKFRFSLPTTTTTTWVTHRVSMYRWKEPWCLGGGTHGPMLMATSVPTQIRMPAFTRVWQESTALGQMFQSLQLWSFSKWMIFYRTPMSWGRMWSLWTMAGWREETLLSVRGLTMWPTLEDDPGRQTMGTQTMWEKSCRQRQTSAVQIWHQITGLCTFTKSVGSKDSWASPYMNLLWMRSWTIRFGSTLRRSIQL